MEEKKVPTHIAIIMDGNRRWAKEKKLPIQLGHKNGADTLEKIVKYANKIGIKYMTVYAFSTENWNRTKEEVGALMILLKQYLEDLLKKLDTENVKIRFIGDISVLKKDLQDKINTVMERSKDKTGLCFNVALNYGGRDEIIRMTKKIAEDVKNNKIEIEDINEETISNNLYTYDMPDPDLLIRTSGELRLSGFLIWQMAYTEFLFLDKYWPDFNEKDLDEAIEVYNKRSRRYGAS